MTVRPRWSCWGPASAPSPPPSCSTGSTSSPPPLADRRADHAIPADSVRHCSAEDATFARLIATDLALANRMLVEELKKEVALRPRAPRHRRLSYRAAVGGPTSFQPPFEKRVLAASLGMAPEVSVARLRLARSPPVKVHLFTGRDPATPRRRAPSRSQRRRSTTVEPRPEAPDRSRFTAGDPAAWTGVDGPLSLSVSS